MVVAPLLPDKVAALRALLASMNHYPGSVQPAGVSRSMFADDLP
jgi:hypothetical protein